MQNIEEVLAALTFPEPEPVKMEEPAAVVAAETVTAEEAPVAKNQVEGKKEATAKRVVEEEEEHAKDGVALDELFKMKPEIFQNTGPAEEETSDKKKGKKDKKKAIELEFDEGLGAVVGRKIHKRGGDETGNDWE
jgi:hypothetical protein